MQEKRIGKRLVLLSWDRYQQLIAMEKELQVGKETITQWKEQLQWAAELLNNHRATRTGGVVQK